MGDITMTGVVGGSTALGAVTIRSARDVTLAAVTAASLTQEGTSAGTAGGTGTTTLGGNLTTSTATGVNIITSAIAVNNTITTTTGNGTVTLNASGSTSPALTLADATSTSDTATADIMAGGAVDLTGTGGISISGDITTTNDNITFNSATTLTGAVALNTGTGAGNISFSSTVEGTTADADALTLTAGMGDITMTGVVGGSTALGAVTIRSARDVTLAAVTAASLTQEGTSAGTAGGTGTTTLGGNLTTSTATGVNIITSAIAVNNTITTTTGNGTVTLNASGSTSPALTLADATSTSDTATADIMAGGAVDLTGTGGISISGDITTTNDNITFNSATTLTGAVALNTGSGAGNISFSSTVEGTTADADALTLTAGMGDITMTGVVGGSTALGAVTIRSARDVTLAAVTAASLTQEGTSAGTAGGTGTTTLGGNLTTSTATGVNIITSAIAVNNTITTTTGNGTVTLNASGSTSPALTLADATSTSDTATADIMAGGAVDLTGTGGISISGDITTTNDNITFNSATTLTGAVALNTGTGAGDISFSSTVNGAHALTLTAGMGDITMTGAVGGTTALMRLAITTAGQVDVASVRTSGAQAITANNIDLNGATYRSTGGGITLTGPVDLTAAAVTIRSGGGAGDDITITGAINNAAMAGSRASLTLNAGTGGDIDLQSTANGGLSNATDTVTTVGTGSNSTTYLDTFTITNARNITLTTMVANTINITAQNDITAVIRPMISNQDIRARTGDLTIMAGGTLTLADATDVTTTTPDDRRTRLVAETGAVALTAATLTTETNDTTNAPQIVSAMPIVLGAGGGTIGIGSQAAASDMNINDETLNSTGGCITIGSASSGRVSLDMATAFTGSLLTIITGAAIDDNNMGTAFESATGHLVLTSGGAIGSASGTDGLSMDVAQLTITATGGSAVRISNAGSNNAAYTIGSMAAVGAVTLAQTANTMTINQIQADGAVSLMAGTAMAPSNIEIIGMVTGGAADTITINAASITGMPTGVLSGGGVSLTAVTGIGGSPALRLRTGAISATTASGDITISNAMPAAVRITAMSTGGSGGDIRYTQANNQSLSLAGLATTDGNITINNSGGTGADITIVDAGIAGDMTNGVVTINATGAINDAQINFNTITDITAHRINLTAAAGVGGMADVDMAASELMVTVSAAGNVVINEADSISLAGISISDGNFSLTTTGDITSSTSVSINGTTRLNAGSASITLDNANNDFMGAVSLVGANATLRDSNAIAFGNSTLSGTLNVMADGDMTQSGAVSVAGTTRLNVGNHAITLNDANNDFMGAVSIAGIIAGLTLVDSNDLTLGAVTTGANASIEVGGRVTFTDMTGIGGQLMVTGAAIDLNNTISADSLRLDASTGAGAISQTAGSLMVAGEAEFLAQAGDDITLNDANNDFMGAVSLVGANATLRDSNAIAFGNSTLSGTLNVMADGDMTQSGAVSVAGTTRLNVGNHAITLNDANNDFMGAVSLVGANATLRDSNAIAFGNSTLSGTLNVMADGDMTQSGAVSVAGTTRLNVGNHAITLNDANNDFMGAVSIAGIIAGLTLVDSNDLTLGAVTTGANASIEVGGRVTFTDMTGIGGQLMVTGAAIDLNNTISADSLRLDASTGAGAISQTAGSLMVAGEAEFLAQAGDDITLNDANNDFMGAVSLVGANATLRDSNAIAFGNSTLSGTLNVMADGDMTQSGAVSVAGTTRLNVGNHAITLNDANNDFMGAVSIAGIIAGLTLVDSNDLTLGAVTTGANASIEVGGRVTFTDMTGHRRAADGDRCGDRLEQYDKC